MPRVAPPRDCPTPGGPIIRKLLAGSVWWRIHSEAHEPTAFRDTGAVDKRADPGRFGEEGRFDCQAGEYSYLYLGSTKSSTIAEAYLRGPAVADPAARFLRGAKLRGRVLSRIELTVDLDLVDLRGARGLARIGQDAWLTACDEPEYPVTQEWATALRRWAPPPSAAGLLWMSKRDNLHHAAMLFGDGVPAGAITGHVHRRLEDGLGRTLVEKVLAGFGMAVT
jgi:hypothetical protein